MRGRESGHSAGVTKIGFIVSILGLALAATASPSAQSERRATLRLAGTEPLTLAGSRFVARERVRVTVTVNEDERERVVRARSDGRFRVSFAGVVVDRCNSAVRAVARGAAGSRAALKLPELLCPPSLRAAGG